MSRFRALASIACLACFATASLCACGGAPFKVKCADFAASSDCLEGYTCDPQTEVCLRSCDFGCLASQYCDPADSVCRPGTAPPAGGD